MSDTHNKAPISRADFEQLAASRGLTIPDGENLRGPNPFTGEGKDGFCWYWPQLNASDRSGDFKKSRREMLEYVGISVSSSPSARNRDFTASISRNGTTQGAAISSAQNGAKSPKAAPFDWNAAQKFDYTDENGVLLFQVGRIGDGAGKQIRQRRPNGAGGFASSLDGARRVLYRLPDVLAAQTVFLCEGEKAADALNAALEESGDFGPCVATCNPMGAGKWRDEYNAALEVKTVCVLADNDDVGRVHAQSVCASIHREGAARFLARLDLEGLPEKGDVYEWLEAGGDAKQLLEIALNAEKWEPEKTPCPFRFQTLSQLAARPAPQWLIHRLLTCGGTSLLTAKHASFKSFIALDMALSIACDRPWQGFEVKQGKVLYIAAEGAAGLTKRALAWQAHHDADAGENFVVLDVPLKIHEPQTRAEFIGAIGAIAPTLIVLDTLARCAVGLDENNSGDMGVFADAVGELAKATGAHVLTVHHNNKNGDYRGSTALPAAVDTHLSLDRNREGDAALVFLKTEKQKDFEELETLTFEGREVAIPGTEGKGFSLVFEKLDTRAGDANSLSSSEKKVLNELSNGFGAEGATASQWGKSCEEAGIANRTFRYAKEKLVKIGAVSCPEKGARGAKFFPCPDWGKSGQKGNCPDDCPDNPKTANGLLEDVCENANPIEEMSVNPAWGNGAKSGQSGQSRGNCPDCPDPSESRGNRGNTPLGVAPSCPDSEDGAARQIKVPKFREGAKGVDADFYGAANPSSEAATENAARDFAANFGQSETDGETKTEESGVDEF